MNNKEIIIALPKGRILEQVLPIFNKIGITPEKSVKGLIARIDQLNLENTGTFWHSNGEVLPW